MDTSDYRSWEAVQKAKTFYKECMDEKKINDESSNLLKLEVTPSWPTLGLSSSVENDQESIIFSFQLFQDDLQRFFSD